MSSDKDKCSEPAGNSCRQGLRPGTIVGGRCRVLRCLGMGSMGYVYACEHRSLPGMTVAMKVLFSEISNDHVAISRFRNEIVAAYGVSHPHVVRAFEYFRDGDLAAYTMEYVNGGDLSRILLSHHKLELKESVKLLCQLASGMGAIHDANIVHRDLKPENILLTDSHDVKIADFGIVRRDHWRMITDNGGVLGTLDYVSPEYLEKGEVDARSDIFAFGVIAYELITGHSPFESLRDKNFVEAVAIRIRFSPTPASVLNPNCPEALNALIMRALERDPAARFKSAEELLNSLLALSPATWITPASDSRANSGVTVPRVSAPGVVSLKSEFIMNREE